MELTPEQIAHRKIMDEVNAAFKETPIAPVTPQLLNLSKKFLERGLRLDPRQLCKLIDAEAARQYQELFDAHFRGQHISTLTAAKDEIIKWYNDEEERFSKFKDAYLSGALEPEVAIDAPSLEKTKVLPMKKKVKK
jgi:hypothetical protein